MSLLNDVAGPALTPWYDDLSELISFGRVMCEVDGWFDQKVAFDYVEKPYKWHPEHETWVAHGRPMPPERGDTDELDRRRWQRFVEEFNVRPSDDE